MGISKFFEDALETIKTAAKFMKDTGFDYNSAVTELKKMLEKMVEDFIKLKWGFLEWMLERLVILTINIVLDKIVKEVFETEG